MDRLSTYFSYFLIFVPLVVGSSASTPPRRASTAGERGPGYAHFPLSYDEGYFKHLISEQVMTRYFHWKPVLYFHLARAGATKHRRRMMPLP